MIPTNQQTICNLIDEKKLSSIQDRVLKVSRLDLKALDPDDYMGIYLVK